MANTTSATSSSSMTNLNRMAGLASGLDTESLVKAMASNSLTRYNRKASKLQTLQWKQELYRNQITSLKSFSDKYLTNTSKFSIKLNSNMAKMASTSSNSKVSVTATTNAIAGNFTITQASSATKTSIASSGGIMNSNINLDFSKFNVDDILSTATSNYDAALGNYNSAASDYAGATLNLVDYMGDFVKGEFTDELKQKYGVDSWDDAITNLKSEYAAADPTADNTDLYKRISDFANTIQNNLDSEAYQDSLMSSGDTSLIDGINTTKAALNTAKTNLADAEKAQNDAKANENGLKTSISITLDGRTKSIKINSSSADDAKQQFITGVNEAFNLTDGGNKFELSDSGSLIYNNSTNDGIHHTFNVKYNSNIGLENTAYSDIANSDTLGSISFANSLDFTTNADGKEVCNLEINGKNFEFNKDTSISSMLSTINNADTGFKMSFSTFNQSFKLEATETGANNPINVSGSLADSIFGSSATRVEGKNATITIANEDGNPVNYTSVSNVFTFDGTSIDVSKLGNFKAGEVDANGNIAEAIEISTTKDISGTKDFIVNFINDYNKLIDGIRTEMTTARPKSSGKYYEPLTDDQRKEMSTEEIEKWENQAKVGLLYQDSYLNKVLMDLQGTMSKSVGGMTLSSMGIASKDWKDYGKLTIDEDKLDKCLLEHGDKVADFFTNSSEGVGKRLTDTVNKAISTTGNVGYLTGYAGIENSMTDKKNALYNEINSLQKVVSELKSRYEKEMERYWARFTTLETYMSQMNSQASIFMSDY